MDEEKKASKAKAQSSYNTSQNIKINIRSKEEKDPDFSTQEKPRKKSKKRKVAKKLIFLTIFLFTCSFVFSSGALVSEESGGSWLTRLPIIKQIKNLAESADRGLKGEERGRINMLLLGMGGKSHEGGYLTDTIMVASVDLEEKKIALVSIPRDLAVPVEDMDWQKINHINAYAEVENEGSGGLAISQAVSDVLNIPIDYYIRVDFQGFVDIVDELGGLNVYVENTLDDYQYPIMGNEEADWEERFEHLHVDEGWQKMDGELALKFARSRYGINGEGSDFARASRQQKILEATKNKVLSMDILFQPTKISGLITQYQKHVSTNLKIWEIVKFWNLVKDIDRDHIINKVIDNSPDGLLVDGRSEIGAYILKPRSGDFTEIQYYVNNVFSDAPQEQKSVVSEERATIEVRNGTWINGLAAQTAMDLEKYGFIVVRIGNTSRQNFEKSVIYDLTYGEKMESLTILKNRAGADLAYSLPEWLVEDIKNELEHEKNPVQPDFILVIGHSADETESGAENNEEEIVN